jgi:hypothetical protein
MFGATPVKLGASAVGIGSVNGLLYGTYACSREGSGCSHTLHGHLHVLRAILFKGYR